MGEVEPILWLRFIDAILVVWPVGGRGFTEFLDQLNAFHPSLKYTNEKSDTDINFLDLTIYKGTRFSEKQVLDLRPYFKKYSTTRWWSKWEVVGLTDSINIGISTGDIVNTRKNTRKKKPN